MFSGFNLKLEENELIKFSDYEEIGRYQISEYKANFKNSIEQYIEHGIVDGTEIEKDWFPQIDADVFISHSHIDEKLAYGLAGWLYDNFKLKSFIDACIWGSIDDLLEMLNAKFSNKRDDGEGGHLYNHQKCNTVSKHVNTMLMIALQKMIDKTEAIILLNTSNSIDRYDECYGDVTYSPWINAEIVSTQLIRRKSLMEYRKKYELLYESREVFKHVKSEFNVKYDISLEHLKEIDLYNLKVWQNVYRSNETDYPLDCLYGLVFEDKMRNER